MTKAFVGGGMAARILGGVLRISGAAQKLSVPQAARSVLFGLSLVLVATLGAAQTPAVAPSSEAAIRIFSEGQRLNQQELAAAQGRVQAKSTDSTARATAASTGSVTRVPVYRFFNTQNGAHLYTTSVAERNHIRATMPHMTYEGVSFEVSSTAASGFDPVYRFFNQNNGTHFYTISEAERNHLVANAPFMRLEGVAHYASKLSGGGRKPLYRFHVTSGGFHFFTASEAERSQAASRPNYRYEGIAYYVLGANQAPTVTLTSPTAGASFTAPASITLSAQAADADGSVASVAFYNGSTRLRRDTTAPYSFNWANVPAGTYNLTARATDNNGATRTSATVRITVSAANQAPTVSLTSPAAGASFSAPASINITATGADSDGSVASVAFYNGATLLGTDTSAPYSFNWSDVPAGAYSLTARATDDDGATTTSAAVNITVDAPQNQAPTVALTSPAAGASFNAPANIALTANAADTDGTIASVAFYNGATLLGTDASAPYSFNWADVSAGTYSLTAIATDNDGATTASAPVSITVEAPQNQVPTVALTSPTAGASFTAPASISLSATASDADGTIASVAFYNGATLLGTASSAPFNFAWTNVPAGTYSLTAVATDDDGATTTSPPVSVTVGAGQNLPPMVNIYLPGSGWGMSADGNALHLEAEASDPDGSIVRVEFYDSGELLGTVEVAPYFYGIWGRPIGERTLYAIAYDDQGAATTSNLVVGNVYAAGDPPTVSLTSPSAGATFTAPANINLTAEAADNDGTIAGVEFYVGGTSLGYVSSPPFGFTWPNVPVGTYSLTARASDITGNITESAPVSITVTDSNNQAPTVALTSPVAGANFTAPASITLTADAEDTDGSIASVAFYDGATLLGTATSAPYSFDWVDVPAGTYSLTAVATDDGGATSTSAIIDIEVTGENQPPSVVVMGDGGGPFGDPTTFTVEAQANDPEGELASVAFYADGTLLGIVTSAPYSLEWPNVSRGIYTLTAVATDAQGASTTSAPVGVSVDCRIALEGGNEGRRYRMREGAMVGLLADPCIGPVAVAGIRFSAIDPEQGIITYSGSTGSNPSFPTSVALESVGGTLYQPIQQFEVRPWMERPDGAYLYFLAGFVRGITNPSVSLVSPAAGTVHAEGQDIALQAIVLDCTDCTSQVDFYLADAQQSGGSWIPVNERLLGSLPGHAQFLDDIPYELTWSAPPAGRYFLRARAIDTDGVVVESEPVQIRVVAPPQVSILSPSTGDTYEAPANILITASATSNGEPVARVDFYRGATLLGTDTTAPFEFNWTGAPEGSYVLTAVATNAVEVSVTSEPVTVTVNASPSETITYIHTDLSGSPLAATNANGNVVWKENYRAYGERRLGQPGSEGQRQWFHGKEADASTGLQYFGARYYDPAVGRFMGVDPVTFQEGNLHSFNRYAYGNNNPVKYLDPDGNNAVTAFGGLLTESYNFLSGQGFNGAMVLGALRDGYDGEGAGFWHSAGEDAMTFGAGAVGAVARGAMAARVSLSVTTSSKGGAASAKQAADLSKHLGYTEKYGKGGVKGLENGRIRYYGGVQPANKAGDMAGRRYVHEYDVVTGRSRGWHETLDHSGNVRQVRPELNNGSKIHYQFDRAGRYDGSW